MIRSRPAGSGTGLADHVSSCSSLHGVVWFKRDLRLHDHAPLFAAIEEAAEKGLPIALLVIDEPDDWRQPDRSTRHRRLVCRAVDDLECQLAARGAHLLRLHGHAVEVLGRLHGKTGFTCLYSHEETGNEWSYGRDKAVSAWCRDAGVRWLEFIQNGVQRGLRRRQGWARVWEQRMGQVQLEVPHLAGRALPADSPVLAGVNIGKGFSEAAHDDASAMRANHSEGPILRADAFKRLDTFLSRDGMAYRGGISSPVSAQHASSRLSVALSWGTVSLREIVHRTRQRRQQIDPSAPHGRAWRASLASFDKRLHWHCHFIQKLETQPEIEWASMHPAADGLDRLAGPSVRLAAWQAGETGWPFVDACMRMLNATGWLNFRMRAMLMAVASYHLWLDWRHTGLHLARQFADYEPGIHWPQVQMQSGTTGINTFRIYNPVKQGRDHDAQGTFIARWVPELASLPVAMRHTPWMFAADDLRRHGVQLGRDYPYPEGSPEDSARRAREKMKGLRSHPGFAEVARDLQSRLGSQASGLNRAQRGLRDRRLSTSAGNDRQGTLF